MGAAYPSAMANGSGQRQWALLTSRPPVQAHLLVGALEAEDIEVRLVSNGLGSVYGQNTFAARLYVAPADLEQARALLYELDHADAP